jgi:2-keto-4-pentenoate hydratase
MALSGAKNPSGASKFSLGGAPAIVIGSSAGATSAPTGGTHMDLHRAMDMIWEAHRRGVYCPPELKGKLTMDEAYRVNLGFLERRVKEGERHAGWKVGLTAESIRKQIGYHEPIFGVLLASGHKPSGLTFKMSELIAPGFETEPWARP